MNVIITYVFEKKIKANFRLVRKKINKILHHHTDTLSLTQIFKF